MKSLEHVYNDPVNRLLNLLIGQQRQHIIVCLCQLYIGLLSALFERTWVMKDALIVSLRDAEYNKSGLI